MCVAHTHTEHGIIGFWRVPIAAAETFMGIRSYRIISDRSYLLTYLV